MRLDLIDKRSDVFLDVLYDLCVIVLQRTSGKSRPTIAKSSLLRIDEPDLDLGLVDIPAQGGDRVWAIPNGCDDAALFGPGFHTLTDYGYITKTGYFVWNREKRRYRIGSKPRPDEVPLIWAHNIRANEKCIPQDGDSTSIGFVKISASSSAIIHSDAIILQRTTNRRQRRRLIAAKIHQAEVNGGGGFVTENHTIVIVPDPAQRQLLSLSVLCRLLNTSGVDARFRRISGSVSVSTKALRDLPLPTASDVRRFFGRATLSDDAAAVAAYKASAARKRAPRKQTSAKRRE